MKTVVYWLKFHWNMFLKVWFTICKHYYWIRLGSGQRERERERLSLSAFLRTEDIGVHIVHISRLIITYTLVLDRQTVFIWMDKWWWPCLLIHLHICNLALICKTTRKWINSLAPGRFDYSLKLVNFKLISTINIFSIFCQIAIRLMPQHLTDH